MATLRLWGGAPQRPPRDEAGERRPHAGVATGARLPPVARHAHRRRARAADRLAWPRRPGYGRRSAGRGPRMQRIQWSTDGVPEREQFAVWRDEWQVPFGIRPEREGPAAAPFKGTVVTRRVGPAVHTRARSDAHTAVRGRAEIARRGWDAYVLYREAGGGAWFDRGGREFVAEAGDLTISDPNLPYATRAPEGFAFDFWVLPRTEIDRHLPAGGPPPSLHLAGRDPLGDVLGSYMDALARQLDALPEPAAEPMLDNLCRLVAITAGAAGARAGAGGPGGGGGGRAAGGRRHPGARPGPARPAPPGGG